MANKATPDKIMHGTLQRGKACLRCRKRKMRCDGTKPACQQCIRSKRSDICEYDDGKGKTRTQLLREHIARLEQRIKELEDPEYISPAVTLYDPHMHSRSGSSTSSFGSPGSVYLFTPLSRFPSESSTSPQASWKILQNLSSPPVPPLGPEILLNSNRGGSQPSVEVALMLLDIFAVHRHQCGLEVHMNRLREALIDPIHERRNSTLLNAVYLWACFVSRPEPLSQHEQFYLDSTLQELPDALRNAENVMDVIQASCLLSQYFLANGRFVEGGYHASAAASLAMQSGLNDKATYIAHVYDYDKASNLFDLKPPRIDVGTGERILTFWQVYNLDRCWSVVLRKPTVIPDSVYSRDSITCPWPQSITEYESGPIDSSLSLPTIKAFLHGEVDPNSFSIQALRVKASTLFSCADNIAVNWDRSMKMVDTLNDVQKLEHGIAHFLPTLINMEELDAVSAEDRFSLLATHTLTYTAVIKLFQSLSAEDVVSFEKCARAARSCTVIIKQLSDQDYAFLDPIVGVSPQGFHNTQSAVIVTQ
ncbi:hypothetical protein AX17_005734 [Amanita inopinata Kibby_2008]|nr:hypothetical protein AX17_005734 [Amanita inopinata Kibby_2008]